MYKWMALPHSDRRNLLNISNKTLKVASIPRSTQQLDKVLIVSDDNELKVSLTRASFNKPTRRTDDMLQTTHTNMKRPNLLIFIDLVN